MTPIEVALVANVVALAIVFYDSLKMAREMEKWRQTGRCPTCQAKDDRDELPPSGWAV